MHEVMGLQATDPHAFNLDEEMVKRITQEFDFVKAARSFCEELKDRIDAEILEKAQDFFSDFGRRLMLNSLAEGEKHQDLTYITMKEYIEKTGVGIFPLVPQRYIEIANLCAMPIFELEVTQNNADKFSYRICGCAVYQVLSERIGKDKADKLPCRFGCLTLCKTAVENLDLKAAVIMEAEQPIDGYCEFSLVAKR
jgi:hypothetical protein